MSFPISRGITALVASLTVTAVTAVAQPFPPLPNPPVPPQNPITEPKRVLGKILFWEEQLSSDNSVSCGTCHLPASAGSDPRPGRHPGPDNTFFTPDDKFGSRGVPHMDANGEYVNDTTFGFDPQVTTRSAQSVVGSAFSNASMFWDGRATSQFLNPETGAVSIPLGGAVESQSIMPILNSVEMGNEGRTWADVRAKLLAADPLALAADIPPDMSAAIVANPTYPALFAAAFGDPAITAERIGFAIATYERTLIPNQTPWDAFNAGNPNALTPGQQAGLNAFVNSGRCNICHLPPFFTNQTFRNIGLRPIGEDNGRQAVTGDPADRGRFKVPTLRNVGLKTEFMHTGHIVSIPQVINFYVNAANQQFPDNRDPVIPTIALSPQQRTAIIDFLQNALTDPRVASEAFPFDRPILRSELRPGDVNGDGAVDLADLSRLLTSFGSCESDSSYDIAADFDQDRCNGLSDLAVILGAFGS